MPSSSSPLSVSAAGDVIEGTLELTLHLSSANGLRLKPPSAATISTTLLPKSKPVIVAWIDCVSKKSTKTILNSSCLNPDSDDPKLHFPLSIEVLGDPAAALNIQIRTPRRRPLTDRLEGSASIPLASLLNVIADSAGKVITLPLRRPSGRETGGWVRVSARFLWCLNEPVADDIIDEVSVISAEMPTVVDVDLLEIFTVEPSAPPLPSDNCWISETTELVESKSMVVESSAPSLMCTPWMQVENCKDSSPEVGESKMTMTTDDESIRGDDSDHRGVLGSFVVGFASGAALLAGGLYIIFSHRLQHRC